MYVILDMNTVLTLTLMNSLNLQKNVINFIENIDVYDIL